MTWQWVAILILVGLGMAARAAPPADADRALAPWYQQLEQPDGGGSCCSQSDCRPVDSRLVGNHYEAFSDGIWVVIPADKVIHPRSNPTGAAVLCGLIGGKIFCFVPAIEV